jgi:tetratricopeptide (TPR) repeat protein
VENERQPSGDAAMPRRWVMIGVIASAVIVLSLPVYLLKQRVLGARDGTVDAQAATFVGREQCIDCHEAAYEGWVGSDHDRAMAVANDSTVVGDFEDSEFEHGGVVSRFYRRDGKYFVHTEGPGGEMGEFEIRYTFGFEPLQQYLIPLPGGRLQALSTAWDVVQNRWFFLYPGQDIPADDWLHWTRGAQNWNGMCAECHSTNLVKGYDAETQTFNTTWSEIDVSCEACHGPGSLHVAWAEIPPMGRPAVDDYALVIPTSNVTARQQVESCAPCHSRRAELGDYDHRRTDFLSNLVPSELREGLYHADGQILDEVYVYGSFVQSKMYHNDVRCADCHDAHSLRLREEDNALCAQCHRADAYDTSDHHFHQKVYEGAPSDGALCVKCHMPEQPYMVIDDRADHSLRVPRPDLTAELGVPNACTQSGCHDDRPLQWSVDAFRQWYGEAQKPHYGTILAAGRDGQPEALPDLVRLAGDNLYPAIVRATALSLLAGYPGQVSVDAFNRALADEEALVRHTAVRDLNATDPAVFVELVAPLLFDPVNAVRIRAAAQLAGVPRGGLQPYQVEALDTTLAEYRETMEYSLDFAFANQNLGNLYQALGDPERAMRYYESAIEIDDLFFPAKVNLALLYNSMGRNPAAAALLREVLAVDPEQYSVAYNLGLLLAEMGQHAEGVEYLQRASDGLPRQARMHYNLGLTLQFLGRVQPAEAALRKALDVELDNLDFLYALADHYIKRGDPQLALPLAEEMIAKHPQNRMGHDIKAYIEGVSR